MGKVAFYDSKKRAGIRLTTIECDMREDYHLSVMKLKAKKSNYSCISIDRFVEFSNIIFFIIDKKNFLSSNKRT